jgi:hypothetical protein
VKCWIGAGETHDVLFFSPVFFLLLEQACSSFAVRVRSREVRPMFSGFAVYVGDKIVLMLRDSPKHPEDNGAWLVFSERANLAARGSGETFRQSV